MGDLQRKTHEAGGIIPIWNEESWCLGVFGADQQFQRVGPTWYT